ncbi:hypothetical protein GJ496_004222 [Pomphorhynchus laevis]|nr:hypothetical protein GJ496_004222 [Pomphorhynchus laevis]
MNNSSSKCLTVKWNKLIKTTELQMTRILWQAYSNIYNSIKEDIDQSLHSALLKSKCRKLSRLTGIEIHHEELSSFQVYSNRRYKKRKVPSSSVINNFVNMSSTVLTTDQQTLLSLGLSFAPMPREFKRLQLIDSSRYMSRAMFNDKALETTTAQKQACLQTPVIQKYVVMPPNPFIENNLERNQRAAINELRNNNDILILAADKGSKVVILNKEDYINEGFRQLQSNAYQTVNSEYFQETVKSVEATIQKLIPDESLAKSLRKPNPLPGHLFLLPKIHKNLNPCPGRPIY